MRTELSIEADQPEELMNILSKSLESSERIEQKVSSGREAIEVEIVTESLGQLRGCTDTVFRLSSLSKKILER